MENKTTMSWVPLYIVDVITCQINPMFCEWRCLHCVLRQGATWGMWMVCSCTRSYHILLCLEQCQRIKMHNCNLWNGSSSRGLRLLLSYQFSCCPATKVINSVHKNWAEMVTLSNTCEIDIAAAVDSGHRLTNDHCGNITWSLLFFTIIIQFCSELTGIYKDSSQLNDFVH